jgi:hypothetical protein
MRSRVPKLNGRRSLALGAAVLVVAQFIRCDMTNPPIDAAKTVAASPLTSTEMAALFERSCADCHSDATEWPRSAAVAPVSWLVWYDVDRARRYLNLSRWATYKPERALVWVRTACDAVKTKRMPLRRYVWAHPEAALDAGDVERVCQWAASIERDLRSRPTPASR